MDIQKYGNGIKIKNISLLNISSVQKNHNSFFSFSIYNKNFRGSRISRLTLNILTTIISWATLPTHWRPAQIEIQHANEDIAKLPLEIISNIKERFDCCIDLNEVALITENEKLWNAIKGLKNKGIRVRFVTGVNEGNISSCRQLMKCGEVFHNDKVKGNFQIADGINYLCYIIENEGETSRKQKQEQQLFHTNTKSFVDIQQYLFDNLCNNAIPAREKIKEIEKRN